MFDLISIGDTRIDNYLAIEDAQVHVSKNHQTSQLCLKWGDKIPVKTFTALLGGNSCNNVIGAARLKLKTALVANLGDDASGKRIIETLKKEGITTRYIKQHAHLETEVSTVLNFEGERSILVYHNPWKYYLPDLDKAKWVYFSSVSYSFSKSNLVKQLEQYIERTGARLVFNPGTYHFLYGVKKLPRLLSLTYLFVVNVQEAKRVLEIDEDKEVEIKKLLTKIADLGPRNVVITSGKEGSFAYDGTNFYQMGLFPAKLVESTGAGDAFSTGLLAGLHYGEELPEALRWGSANSAAVIERIGPTAGLLSLNQIKNTLRDHPKIKAKILK